MDIESTMDRSGLDRVSRGPFDFPPVDLFPYACLRPDGMPRSGPEIHSRSAAWLIGVLRDADVELGDEDRDTIDLIADDGWPTVQVVAGWIRRAGPLRRRPPP